MSDNRSHVRVLICVVIAKLTGTLPPYWPESAIFITRSRPGGIFAVIAAEAVARKHSIYRQIVLGLGTLCRPTRVAMTDYRFEKERLYCEFI